MTMISVKGLRKEYDSKPVVQDISFELAPGKCVALLGPNGAGKTTTLRMLSGLIRPTSGSIDFEGMDQVKDIRSLIGYLPQHPVFHQWMTGKEFLLYVGQLASLTKKEAKGNAEELLAKVGLSDVKNKRIRKYSGGMKQRLGIAQAMIHKPKLLMLDEPVSALDPIGRREVLTLMEELKKETTVLFSTHILNDAEEASDELLLMHNGKIVESGALEDVRSRHQVKKIDLRFDGNSTAEYAEELQDLPNVERVEETKSGFTIYVDDIETARHELLKTIDTNRWPLDKFEVGKVKLEELFMKVVNGE